jgi:hypothetical protein
VIQVSEAKKTLLKYLSETSKELVAILPAEGLEAMLAFYASERASHCALGQDGDMLLYQWGTYDWGQGERFELNITRQFITKPSAEDDDDIKQLSLTFRFVPAMALRQVGKGNRWCHNPGGLPELRNFIRGSAAFAAAVPPLAAIATEQWHLAARPGRSRNSEEMAIHRAKPEEAWDEPAVGDRALGRERRRCSSR